MPTFEDLLPQADQISLRSTLDSLAKVAEECVANSTRDGVLVAYSSGIDSSILAELVRRQSGSVKLLTMGRPDSTDVRTTKSDTLATRDGFELSFGHFTAKDVQSAGKIVSEIVHVDNLSHFEDCISFWLMASIAAKTGDERCIFSANGPDELFCGYDRFRRIVDEGGYVKVEMEISKALEAAKKLAGEVSRVVSDFGFQVIEPFTHETFRKFAISIPVEYKIHRGNDLLRKRIWRCFGRALGLPEETVMRRKKAMQYGMGIHAVVLSMVKKDLIKVEFGKVS